MRGKSKDKFGFELGNRPAVVRLGLGLGVQDLNVI